MFKFCKNLQSAVQSINQKFSGWHALCGFQLTPGIRMDHLVIEAMLQHFPDADDESSPIFSDLR